MRTQEASIWVFESLLRLFSVFVYLHIKGVFISEILLTESQLLQKGISSLGPVLLSPNVDGVLMNFYTFRRLPRNHKRYCGCLRVITVGIAFKFLDSIRVKDFAI
jgi:hypothetical protein